MKIVKYDDVISADGYEEYLLTIADKIPNNAYKFASDSNRYDFYGRYCTHDLKFLSFEINESNGIFATLKLKKMTLNTIKT